MYSSERPFARDQRTSWTEGIQPEAPLSSFLPDRFIFLWKLPRLTVVSIVEALRELDKRCKNWSFLPDRFTFLKTQREKHCGTLRKKL
jgi:hypothetical protein